MPDPSANISSATPSELSPAISQTGPENILGAYRQALHLSLAKQDENASPHDIYTALALACRNRLVRRWIETDKHYRQENGKHVYYLSLEFLMGRYLQNAVLNMDIESETRQAMQSLGMALEDIYEGEHDPGLGNGGLGRLAACFLDSMATHDIPACGYGIRYEYGIFQQKIINGYQRELPDQWLARGNPWEIARPEEAVAVHFYGRSEAYHDSNGKLGYRWSDTETVLAMPYDTPVPGHETTTVNTLRLWSAKSSEGFDLDDFNRGNFLGAVSRNMQSEAISKILYPSDEQDEGRELRLKQEYFFVAASLHDIVRNHLQKNRNLENLSEKAAIQLNDTHPAIAVAELMRLLCDEHLMGWEKSWSITCATMAYTNHTILPEALECWTVALMRHLLPRHLEIIEEINRRFLCEASRRLGNDAATLRRISIIEYGTVRMAHLAIVGSHSVNGVAKLHTKLLKQQLVPDFYQLFPERFNNKTNGITPRRWLKQANPALSLLISRNIGDGWIKNLRQLEKLRPLASDAAFRADWRAVKAANKEVFSNEIYRQQGLSIDPDSMFDVQVKRIHAYKRQLLNLLHIIARYFLIKEGALDSCVPRTIMIGGKAAPSYTFAKLVIKLATSIAERVRRDSSVRESMQLLFLENYGVSMAERVIPATDLSEQISTAGFEASGTGNMKFALNGALTIGTMDGANIEISEAVGAENFFSFGLSAEEVMQQRSNGYSAEYYIRNSPLLVMVLDSLRGDFFSPGEPGLFEPLYNELVYGGDAFMLLADFDDYLDCQRQVDQLYANQEKWTQKAILNVSAMGPFSSDETIRAYAKDIWRIKS